MLNNISNQSFLSNSVVSNYSAKDIAERATDSAFLDKAKEASEAATVDTFIQDAKEVSSKAVSPLAKEIDDYVLNLIDKFIKNEGKRLPDILQVPGTGRPCPNPGNNIPPFACDL